MENKVSIKLVVYASFLVIGMLWTISLVYRITEFMFTTINFDRAIIIVETISEPFLLSLGAYLANKKQKYFYIVIPFFLIFSLYVWVIFMS